ncbi:hypothetical protein [Methanoregula sp.]|uniref:hypothetical protein n=1 Tax=Methanoregula sp. TaxID=2052170 RepID=UPI002C7B088A|nr:hypothetical protein [Methanoregula sp.]HVP95702.1 hypothetical protein [Methanoregula sp.]
MLPTLPFGILAAAEEPEAEGITTEILLNRTGINTIDLPRGNALVECGGILKIRFRNRGAPIHITATTSNAGMFTDFFHENMYVIDEVVLGVPLRKECSPGFFDIDIIAGYGAMKATLRVEVIVRPSREELMEKEAPVQPEAHGRPHLLMVAMAIGLALYCTWYYTRIEIFNLAAFITLIVGALYVWYRQT